MAIGFMLPAPWVWDRWRATELLISGRTRGIVDSCGSWCLDCLSTYTSTTIDSSSSTYTSKKVNGPHQALALSKLLKEARQLGYGSINSTSDAMISKEWIKRMIVTIDDMSLGTEMRLRVATRLLEGRSRIWWESLKSRSFGQVTW